MAGISFQEKRKLERVIYSLPVILILFFLIIWVLWGATRVALVKIRVGRELESVNKELKQTSAARVLLEERNKGLDSPEGMERETRERFNFQKPGEELVVFLDPESEIPAEESERGKLFSWSAISNFFKRLWR